MAQQTNRALFKNSVTIAGTIEDFELEVKEYKDKNTGEAYDAMVGSITLRVVDSEEDENVQLSTLRVFQRDRNRNGAMNQTYQVYSKWLSMDRESVLGTMVSVGTAFSPNAFVSNTNGELIKTVQIQAGFINTSRTGNPRAEFRTDTLLTQPPVEETDSEGESTGRAILQAEVFDFRNMAFPIKFILERPEAIEYFESLDLAQDNPALLEVWGDAVNSRFTQEREVESAFGDPKIEIREFTRNENIITGASTEQKEITEELFEKIQEGKSAYNVYLDSVENRNKQENNAFDKKDSSDKKDKPKKQSFSF